MLHRFMMANYQQYQGQFEKADYWYQELQKEPLNAGFYIGYVPFLQSSGKLKELLPLIPELDKTFKTNLEIQSTIAQALEKSGDNNAAQDRLIKLNDLNKANQELAFKVAQIYLTRQEPENALAVIHAFLNSSPRKPNNFIFYFLEAQIYLLMNKKDEAYTAIKTCLDTYPKFDKGWLLYAVMEEQAGNLAQAISGFASFLELATEKNNDVEQHLLQLAVKQRFGDQANSTQAKHSINKALALFEQREYRKALAELDCCIKEKPDSVEAQLAKIQVLVTQKEYTKAVDLLVSLAQTQPNDIWLETLHLLYTHGAPYEPLIAGYDKILKKHPSLLSAHLFKVDILLKEDNKIAALHGLLKAESLAKNPQTKARILYQCAIIYYEDRQFNPLKRVLTQIQEIDPTFAPAFNLFAYYWATTGKDLKRADDLIAKALAQDEQNPHFLDTLALIRYKQMNYEQALIILEKTIGACPEDTVMLKHLSKTLYKLGKHDRALTTLKTAQLHAKSSSEKSKLNALVTRWSTAKT
jgi:tetratricopeptide (TPR) repeat protein